MTHPLAIQPIGWDSPPDSDGQREFEIAKEEFIEAKRNFNDSREDLRVAIQELKQAKTELLDEFGLHETDLESILYEQERKGLL